MTSTVAAPSATVRRARYSLIAANMDLRLSRRGAASASTTSITLRRS
jgi:hypothetical protein